MTNISDGERRANTLGALGPGHVLVEQQLHELLHHLHLCHSSKTFAGGWVGSLVSEGRSAYLSSDKWDIARRIARRPRYQVCWMVVLVFPQKF